MIREGSNLVVSIGAGQRVNSLEKMISTSMAWSLTSGSSLQFLIGWYFGMNRGIEYHWEAHLTWRSPGKRWALFQHT